MSRANDACLPVGQQHGAAVRRQDAEDDAGLVCNKGIGLGAGIVGPVSRHDGAV